MLPTCLLTTKLYQPPVDNHWVARPELIHRLQESLRHKLTLVSAPPGFGKTTLVSQWLDNLRSTNYDLQGEFTDQPSFVNQKSKIQNRVAWLSLEEGDNQLAQFLRYFIAAVRTSVPGACAATQSLVTATEPVNVD